MASPETFWYVFYPGLKTDFFLLARIAQNYATILKITVNIHIILKTKLLCAFTQKYTPKIVT